MTIFDVEPLFLYEKRAKARSGTVRVEPINPDNPTNAANVPFLQEGLFSWKARAYSPPLNLCMIAAYTSDDIEVSITDECVKPFDFNKDVDLVGLTTYTNSAPRAYQIADAFRQRNVPVVMGGVHASSFPEEALDHCDSVGKLVHHLDCPGS